MKITNCLSFIFISILMLSLVSSLEIVNPNHDGYISKTDNFDTGISYEVNDTLGFLKAEYTSSGVSLNDYRSYFRFNLNGKQNFASANITFTHIGSGSPQNPPNCPRLYKINDYYSDAVFNQNDFSHPEEQLVANLPCAVSPYLQFVHYNITIPLSFLTPNSVNAFMLKGTTLQTTLVSYGSTERGSDFPLLNVEYIPAPTSPKLKFRQGTASNYAGVIGSNGVFDIKGVLSQNQASITSSTADFIVRNNAGTIVALLDYNGNLRLKGTYATITQAQLNAYLSDGQTQYVVRTSSGNAVAVIDLNGNLYLLNGLRQNIATPQ